ncbi:PREDICTED: protein starmaker-like [Wasmannia auropunctata]|uniref:protein starmaker-like n=1 Tax=Wasmannia auropunctata TaxID=64793 RepID=UPI0005ED6FAA|nr:PREDICTED: protein starmaker-like [Wasmannia auropunctata]
MEAEHKKLKTQHPSFKRPMIYESAGSGNPAPHKKIKPDELSPYEDSDDDRKIPQALKESDSDDATTSYFYETDYDTDDSEIGQKGEKRKHLSSSSNHEQRKRRKSKKKRKHVHESNKKNIEEQRDEPKDTPEHADEAEGCGSPERHSDSSAIYEYPRKARRTPDDASAKASQKRRLSENHTTGPILRHDLMRWRLKLAEYEYEIKYKPGKKNKNADALSRNPIEEIKTLCPLRAKRARSSSSEASMEAEHKKLKTQHPSFKRPMIYESTGSDNPAPHKKIRPDELSPYEDSDDDRKIPQALKESDSDDATTSYFYETDYDTDDSEIGQKGEKRKHLSSSSNHEQRKRRKSKKKRKHVHESNKKNVEEQRDEPKDARTCG